MSDKLTKHSLLFSCMTLFSRVLGFIRDMVAAYFFGATPGFDAFVIAFRIPNLLRRLFAEGAFSQAFVPVMAEYSDQDRQQEHLFVSKVAGNLLLVLLVVTLLGVWFAKDVVSLVAPGVQNDPEVYATATTMLQITFPYILFIALTAFCAGVLNCHDRFAGPAFTPVLLNISLIAASILFAPKVVPAEMALAWGVLVAGVLQLLFQLPFMHKIGLLPKFTIDWQDAGVRRILKLMLPAAFGAAISQINILVDTVFASFLMAGSISWLYYADRLMEFPLGIFGVSFATVMLPQLAKNVGNARFIAIMDWGIKNTLLVGLPASIGLCFLAGPIIATLFKSGRFVNKDVVMSAAGLMGYAFAVLGIMLTKVLANAFYARKEITTPVKVGAGMIVVNISLNMLLIHHFAHVGIAIATTITSLLHAGILFWLLLRKKYYALMDKWLSFVTKIMVASSALALFLWYVTPHITKWLDWTLTTKIVILASLIAAGGLLYLGMLFVIGFNFKHIIAAVER